MQPVQHIYVASRVLIWQLDTAFMTGTNLVSGYFFIWGDVSILICQIGLDDDLGEFFEIPAFHLGSLLPNHNEKFLGSLCSSLFHFRSIINPNLFKNGAKIFK